MIEDGIGRAVRVVPGTSWEPDPGLWQKSKQQEAFAAAAAEKAAQEAAAREAEAVEAVKAADRKRFDEAVRAAVEIEVKKMTSALTGIQFNPGESYALDGGSVVIGNQSQFPVNIGIPSVTVLTPPGAVAAAPRTRKGILAEQARKAGSAP